MAINNKAFISKPNHPSPMKLLFLSLALFIASNIPLSKADDDCDYVPVNYTVFNLCPFASITPFAVNSDYGSVTLGLGAAHVPSCDGHETIWGTYDDNTLQCSDVAGRDPTYSLFSKR